MNVTIKQHPDDANLMSYAAGALAEPLSAAIAGHLAMCPRCRAEMRSLRSLGGVLFGDMPFDDGAAEVIPLAKPPVIATPEVQSRDTPLTETTAILPEPIARRYGIDAGNIPWRWLGPGVWYYPLQLSPGVSGDLRLLKVAPGRKLPEHSHGGTEMTLVLDGAYSDASGLFARGDIQDVDGTIEHRPIVDAKLGCICLVASEQPAQFSGVLGRMLHAWTGM